MSDGGEFELVASTSSATEDDVRWERAAGEARLGALASIQATAEKWGTTLLAVTGLVGTVAGIVGSEQLGTLRDPWARAAFGILAALAVFAAGVAVLLAALAAQGKVVSGVITGPELQAASLEAAGTAASRLKSSRRLSVVILPLFVGAMAVLLYAPRVGAELVEVRLDTGQAICGHSANIAGGEITIYDGEGSSEIRVDLSEVDSVRVGAGC